jgi:hypothetical protein
MDAIKLSAQITNISERLGVMVHNDFKECFRYANGTRVLAHLIHARVCIDVAVKLLTGDDSNEWDKKWH